MWHDVRRRSERRSPTTSRRVGPSPRHTRGANAMLMGQIMRCSRLNWAWAWLALGGLSLSTTAWAQTVRNGSIAGTIADNTGAALPGVSVAVTSPALQVAQLVKVSEGDGTYQFVDLPVGTYRLTFELTGFTTLAREDIRVTTGFAARVDVVLALGTLAETVTVRGQSPLVDVTNT